MRCASRGTAPRRSSRAPPARRRARWRGRVEAVTSDDPAARPRPRPSGGASAPPARARRPAASSRAGSTAGRRTGRAPSTGSSGSATTSSVSSCTVASPQACGSSGQRRREREPGGDADARLDRAGDHDRQADVLGDPQAGAYAAQRLHLQYGDVGRLEVAHPVGVGGPADRLVRGDRHRRPDAGPGPGPRPRRPAARRTPVPRPPAPAPGSARPPRRPTSRR